MSEPEKCPHCHLPIHTVHYDVRIHAQCKKCGGFPLTWDLRTCLCSCGGELQIICQNAEAQTAFIAAKKAVCDAHDRHVARVGEEKP